MIPIDLEGIRDRLILTTKYPTLRNYYYWKEVLDETPEQKYKNVPLFEIPTGKYYENHIKLLGSSGTRTYPISYVCFGKYTYGYSKHQVGSRILFTQVIKRKITDPEINHHCWMTPEMLSYWLEMARQESGLDYYFNLEVTDNFYYVTYDFKNLTNAQEKYVLFWGRYTFEYPASLYALDAMLLKRDFYRDELLNNLLILVSIVNRVNSVSISSSQSLTIDAHFMDEGVYKNRLRNAAEFIRDSLYTNIGNEYSEKIYGYQLKPLFNVPTNTLIDWNGIWIDNVSRFDSYFKLYKILDNHRIKR